MKIKNIKTDKLIISLIFIAVSFFFLFKYGNTVISLLSAQVHFAKGYNFAKKKDYVNAMAEYKIAAEKYPTLQYLYQNMGAIFQRQNKYDEAIKYYTLELENNPRNKEVHRAIIALNEYRNQLYVYEKIVFFVERIREYAELNNKFIELISGIKKDYSENKYIKKEEIEKSLNEIKINLATYRDKTRTFIIGVEDLERIKILLVDAFSRRIDAIDYLLSSSSKSINYDYTEKQCIAILKEADIYLISSIKKIKNKLTNIYMISHISLEKELNNALLYYLNYWR